MIGPAHLEDLSECAGPEPLVAVTEPSEPCEPHVVELADRPGGEAVAAGLLPGEVLLLDDDDIPPGFCQPIGARRTLRDRPR